MLRSLRSIARFRRFEWSRTKRRLARCASVRDLRDVARSRLPRGVFDYIDGGAEDERTLERNCDDFSRYELRPRILRDVSRIDTRTTLLGREISFPLVLSPTGFTRIATPQGELDVARAAQRAQIPYTLSTLSTRSIEEVAEVSDGAKWFQVYVWRDRGLVAELLARAREAGYETIIITVDTAVLGRRERDVRNGLSLPPKLGLDTLFEGVRHRSWSWSLLTSEPITFSNVATSTGSVTAGDGTDPVSLSAYINEQFDPSLSWSDLDWFRARWGGSIVLKGVQTVEDAKIAVQHDVDAIALSNHGGRQLDGAPSPIGLVAPVADAVGGQTQILCDGGILRGSDILKALALGADACMAGRAYLYGLAAAGELGVDWVLDHLREGLERAMALSGQTRVTELDPGLAEIRHDASAGRAR